MVCGWAIPYGNCNTFFLDGKRGEMLKKNHTKNNAHPGATGGCFQVIDFYHFLYVHFSKCFLWDVLNNGCMTEGGYDDRTDMTHAHDFTWF